MKTKKQQFCAKTNVFKRTKKVNADAQVNRWRLIDNFRSLQTKTLSASIPDGTFHNAIKPVLLIGQFFGVMPVENILTRDPSQLKFTWKSVRFMFALFITLSCGAEALLTVYWTFSRRVEFGKMVFLVFYVTNFMSFASFLVLAKNWPQLMGLWHDVEKKLPPLRSKGEKRNLRTRMRNAAAIILTLSLIEHLCSVVSSVAIVIDCPRIKDIMKAYYVKSFPQVFTFFPYSVGLGIYIKFIHVTSTFVWTYTDLFIMMISCGLSEKFKLINERMLEEKGKVSCIEN